MLNVAEKTLVIDINVDDGVTEDDLELVFKVFKKVLKQKMKSSFGLEFRNNVNINMGRLDTNRLDVDIIVTLKKANPEDVTDLGDDERIKAGL
jgi:hypothetical protein